MNLLGEILVYKSYTTNVNMPANSHGYDASIIAKVEGYRLFSVSLAASHTGVFLQNDGVDADSTLYISWNNISNVARESEGIVANCIFIKG